MGNAPLQPPQPPQPAFCEQETPDRPASVGLLVVQRYLMPAFFLAVLVLGLPLNLLSLWVFFSQRLKRWRRSTILLFSLTLADTSWLLALPFLVAFHLDRLTWRLGRPLCKAVRLLYHNYFYLSIVFVACISVDRYVAIVHPLRSLRLLGPRRTCALCAAVWAATLLLSVPVAVMSVTQRCPGTNRTVCTLYMMTPDTRESLPYSLFSSVAGFLLPLAAVCGCHRRSVGELRRRGALLPRPPRARDRMRRLARVLTAVLVLFTAIYLPYHLVRNATIAMRALYPRGDRPGTPHAWGPVDLAFTVEMCVCSLNTVINPLFTCLVGRRVRREFRGVLRAARRRLRCAAAAAAAAEPLAAPLRNKWRPWRGAGHGVNTVTPL